MLALATFGRDPSSGTLGIDYVATFEQAMINHWLVQQATIRSKLSAMQNDLPLPYRLIPLPSVVRPEAIITGR
ncbi:MAG: hypothetical protein M3Q45_14045 [Chloroflexota bacterium]|nr:hypothetical protein [Chloroflexota bacterium]